MISFASVTKQFTISALRARRFINTAAGIIVPQSCPACRCSMSDNGFCSTCWKQLKPVVCPACFGAGMRMCQSEICAGLRMYARYHRSHNPRAGSKRYLQNLRAAYLYQEPLQGAIHQWKYRGRIDLTHHFVTAIRQASIDLLRSADWLIPVPLHWKRMWSRQFNQSAELCRGLGKRPFYQRGAQTSTNDKLGTPLFGAVKRIRFTHPQVGLSRRDRLQNLSNAFEVVERVRPKLYDAKIVLVDDVITTGTTMAQIAELLIKSGARSVDGVAITSVDPDQVGKTKNQPTSAAPWLHTQ